MQRPPLTLCIDDAFHNLAVAVTAVMWGVLVMVVASTLVSVSYGGESRDSMFLFLWYARSYFWVLIAVWALFFLAAYARLDWLQIDRGMG